MICPSIATLDSPMVAGDANRGIRYTRLQARTGFGTRFVPSNLPDRDSFDEYP
jgi:hypothetical protein